MHKEITMTINQYLEMERGNLTLKEIMRENDIENLASRILASPQLKKFTITLIATLGFCAKAFAVENIEPIGPMKPDIIINVLKHSLSYICIIAACIEITTCALDERDQEIPKVGLKYIFAYFIIKATPKVFTVIEHIIK